MPPESVHHTSTVDRAWDGPAAVAAAPDKAKVWAYMSAWHAAGNDADGDGLPDSKGDFKLWHHGPGMGTPANLAACRAVMSVLGGGRGGVDIPEADKAGVAAHVQAHMHDAMPAMS